MADDYEADFDFEAAEDERVAANNFIANNLNYLGLSAAEDNEEETPTPPSYHDTTSASHHPSTSSYNDNYSYTATSKHTYKSTEDNDYSLPTTTTNNPTTNHRTTRFTEHHDEIIGQSSSTLPVKGNILNSTTGSSSVPSSKPSSSVGLKTTSTTKTSGTVNKGLSSSSTKKSSVQNSTKSSSSGNTKRPPAGSGLGATRALSSTNKTTNDSSSSATVSTKAKVAESSMNPSSSSSVFPVVTSPAKSPFKSTAPFTDPLSSTGNSTNHHHFRQISSSDIQDLYTVQKEKEALRVQAEKTFADLREQMAALRERYEGMLAGKEKALKTAVKKGEQLAHQVETLKTQMTTAFQTDRMLELENQRREKELLVNKLNEENKRLIASERLMAKKLQDASTNIGGAPAQLNSALEELRIERERSRKYKEEATKTGTEVKRLHELNLQLTDQNRELRLKLAAAQNVVRATALEQDEDNEVANATLRSTSNRNGGRGNTTNNNNSSFNDASSVGGRSYRTTRTVRTTTGTVRNGNNLSSGRSVSGARSVIAGKNTGNSSSSTTVAHRKPFGAGNGGNSSSSRATTPARRATLTSSSLANTASRLGTSTSGKGGVTTNSTGTNQWEKEKAALASKILALESRLAEVENTKHSSNASSSGSTGINTVASPPRPTANTASLSSTTSPIPAVVAAKGRRASTVELTEELINTKVALDAAQHDRSVAMDNVHVMENTIGMLQRQLRDLGVSVKVTYPVSSTTSITAKNDDMYTSDGKPKQVYVLPFPARNEQKHSDPGTTALPKTTTNLSSPTKLSMVPTTASPSAFAPLSSLTHSSHPNAHHDTAKSPIVSPSRTLQPPVTSSLPHSNGQPAEPVVVPVPSTGPLPSPLKPQSSITATVDEDKYDDDDFEDVPANNNGNNSSHAPLSTADLVTLHPIPPPSSSSLTNEPLASSLYGTNVSSLPPATTIHQPFGTSIMNNNNTNNTLSGSSTMNTFSFGPKPVGGNLSNNYDNIFGPKPVNNPTTTTTTMNTFSGTSSSTSTANLFGPKPINNNNNNNNPTTTLGSSSSTFSSSTYNPSSSTSGPITSSTTTNNALNTSNLDNLFNNFKQSLATSAANAVAEVSSTNNNNSSNNNNTSSSSLYSSSSTNTANSHPYGNASYVTAPSTTNHLPHEPVNVPPQSSIVTSSVTIPSTTTTTVTKPRNYDPLLDDDENDKDVENTQSYLPSSSSSGKPMVPTSYTDTNVTTNMYSGHTNTTTSNPIVPSSFSSSAINNTSTASTNSYAKTVTVTGKKFDPLLDDEEDNNNNDDDQGYLPSGTGKSSSMTSSTSRYAPSGTTNGTGNRNPMDLFS